MTWLDVDFLFTIGMRIGVIFRRIAATSAWVLPLAMHPATARSQDAPAAFSVPANAATPPAADSASWLPQVLRTQINVIAQRLGQFDSPYAGRTSLMAGGDNTQAERLFGGRSRLRTAGG